MSGSPPRLLTIFHRAGAEERGHGFVALGAEMLGHGDRIGTAGEAFVDPAEAFVAAAVDVVEDVAHRRRPGGAGRPASPAVRPAQPSSIRKEGPAAKPIPWKLPCRT